MKRWIAIVLAVWLAFTMTGCTVIEHISDILNSEQVIIQEEAIARIGFSTGVLFDNDEEIIYKAAEFADKQAEFSVYRGTLHFDALTENEQTVYRALEYAMENGYTNILVDDLLIEDRETLHRILEFLSLDSPFLEQNLRYSSGDFTTYYPVTIGGLYEENATFDGYYLNIENFEQKYWELKLKALDKAEEIIAKCTDDMSDIQKAEKLFRYVSAFNSYLDYPNDAAVQSYLYDALIEGKTNCDGYANAISLLFRMAGINCVEKRVSDTGNGVGHTWNFAEIDDVWYNFDCTGDTDIPVKETDLHAGRYFAYADSLQRYYPEHKDIYPVSKKSKYITIDAHLANESGSQYRKAVKNGLQKHDHMWAIILLDSYNNTQLKAQMQKVVNEMHCSLYWTKYSVIDGKTLVLIYKEKFLG